MKNTFKRSFLQALTAIVVLLGLLPQTASAATQLTPRSLTLGTSDVSVVTTHRFDIRFPVASNVGSIKFQYCTTASAGCTSVTGLTTTAATLSSQTGASGFSIVNTANGAPYITRTAANILSNTTVSIILGNITNPSTPNQTFFVRITTYASTDTTGGNNDFGTVAASTTQTLLVTATVDETLVFCVYTNANCAAGGGTVTLGTLSSATTNSGISKMDAGTNATSGYVINYFGPTLTSGVNTIAAIGGTAAASTTGSGQFGINATGANTVPAVAGSAAPSGGSGTASANYNTVNQFAFVPSTLTQIASSNIPTNSTTYVVSYIANIPTIQQAGSYAATITYICTATY